MRSLLSLIDFTVMVGKLAIWKFLYFFQIFVTFVYGLDLWQIIFTLNEYYCCKGVDGEFDFRSAFMVHKGSATSKSVLDILWTHIYLRIALDTVSSQSLCN